MICMMAELDWIIFYKLPNTELANYRGLQLNYKSIFILTKLLNITYFYTL